MALIYHATLENLQPTVGDSELVAGNGAVASGDHLSLPNYNSGVYPETPITLGSTYTISMWFKDLKDRSGATDGWLMMDGYSNAGTNGNWAGTVGNYTMSIYTGDELGAWDTGWIGSGYTMTQANFTGNGWHHLVASFDNGTLTYYIDGAQVGNTVSYAGSPNIQVFGSWLNYNYAFADYVDDIQVYDNALSAGDVSTLFAGGRMQLTDGLVATWNFDDDTGDDSVGSAHGTVTDLTYATAAGITYAEADGSGNKMDLGTPAALDLGTSDFTISGWANMDSIPSGVSGAVLYNKGMTSLSNPQYDGTQISFYQGNVRFFVGGQGSYTQISQPMSTGQWYHFMGTRSGTTMKFYINGVLVDTQDTGTVKDITSSLNGSILSNYNGTWYTDAFDGKVADIRIWSRALSGSEAASVHTTGPETGALSLTDGLVAKYALDTDATDSVGSNDGTSHGGASFETTNDRVALRLSADGDYAQIPESLNIGSSGPYTFSVWVKPDNFDSYQTLISDHVHGSDMPSLMIDVLPTSGNVRVRHYNSNSASVQSITSTDALVAGQWNLVTVTWDSSTVAVYLDGALDNSGALTYVPWNSSAPYRVGADTYPNIHVRGSLDDLRIWDRELSASEIATLHSSTQALTDGLVAKYALDTDATDSVGSNDGTNANVTFADGAAQFNGSNARFTLASEPFTASDADYTISVWAKHDNVSNTQRLLGWGDLNGRYFVGYHTGLDKIYIGMGDIDIVPTVAYKPAAGQVEHWVFSNSGNTTKFYKDGVLIDTVVHSATGAISAGSGMRIGSVYAEYGEYLDGSMDDLRIWDRQLSDAEVTTLHAAGAEAAAAAPPAGNTVDVTFLMQDSYGDGWNGSTFVVYDANGATVESHTLAGGYSQTVQFDLDAEPYTWAFVNQNWMSEITATLTRDDTSEQLLFSSAGSVLSGAFDLSAATPEISPTLAASNGEITISATLNAEATAAGATGWAYALTDIFVEGQAHGGTAMAIGVDATESPTPHGSHTIYVAAIDASGNVVVASSASIDNTPVLSITIVKADSYNDSWDGSSLVITNSSAVEVHNATLVNGASPETILLDLPYDTYSWAMVGGSYHNEHTVTITLTSDGTQLAHSAAHSPSSGSFLIGPPAAAITATTSVSGTDITVAGAANATAVSEGAANWSASLTEFGAVGATIDGAKALTALGVDAILTVATGGTHSIYVAVVDGAGVILAKSSVDASVFLTQLSAGDDIIIMSFLEHPSLSPVGPHAQMNADPKWGPFYIGDLNIKSLVVNSQDEDEIVTHVTFDDGSGGDLDMNALVKELIKKYNLNMLWGDNSNDGIFFQSILDGTAGIEAAELLSWNGEDNSTIMLPTGGGHYAEYDALITGSTVSYLELTEVPPGSGSTAGPDGSSFLGIIAPGETAPAQTVGAPAKIRIKFGGAIYTSSVVIKDGNGDWLATFAGEAMAYGNNYYHADALAARDDGKLIHIGDSNAYNSDGNGTPKGSAIGIMTALDGGDSYEISGYTFEYDMVFPEGNYSIHAYAGYDQSALPTSVYILDAEDNLVAQVVSDGSGFDDTYYPVTIGSPAPAAAGAYDWTHGGNLTNIVKFSRGKSASGVASYGYAKKEDNDTTTLYFATDMQTWATFGTYDASASGIDGSPVCMEYGSDGKVFIGTDNGKIYEVTLDGDSVPNTFVPLYTMPGGESINTAKYGATSGEWIFEAGGKMYTIPVDGFVATERYTLPPGAKCVDIAEADDGIAMILRKADFSLEPRFALANWANIVSPAGMSNDMSALNATDLNYSYALDQWVASSADGNILTTADLITFLSA